MLIAVLSDIHGNCSALESVLSDIRINRKPDAVVLLGDLIDYGMRSNEAISIVKGIDIPVICNIWGNHENAILNEDYSRFSSSRGVESAKFTKSRLSAESIEYLNSIEGKSGKMEFVADGKRFLAVHGSLRDNYWKSIYPHSGNGTDGDFAGYESYNYVLSGHSHFTHVFDRFYECDNPEYRNKKKVVFINPGSVGQPRNHNPNAQYALLDTRGSVSLIGVSYDVSYEQSLFTDDVDEFYRDRLTNGV